MKAVMISNQPKWCEKIADGNKTIEVCKTHPKIDTPFKCFIYCTKSKNKNDDLWSDARVEEITINGEKHYDYVADSIHYLNGSVIGEFVCDKIYVYDPLVIACAKFETNGGIVAENRRYNSGACLTAEEMFNYGKGKTLYGWHISDLKIYDEPKELCEFWAYNEELHKRFERGEDYCCYDGTNEYGELIDECALFNESVERCYRCWEEWSGWCHRVIRPPQSWCYVQKIGD